MKYFTIDELSESEKAVELEFVNSPDPLAIANLYELVDNVLDPVREEWGGPITVNSGYRCKRLNIVVGGSTNSHHLYGMAADITVGTIEKNKELFTLMKKMRKEEKIDFTQLIREKGGLWIHVSYDREDLRGQILYK